MEFTLPALVRDKAISNHDVVATTRQLMAWLNDNPEHTFPVYEELQFIAKVAEKLKEEPGFKDFMRQRIKEAATEEEPGETSTARGTTFQLAVTGVKYDYASCGDVAWNKWKQAEVTAMDKRKEREKFLKALEKPTEISFRAADGSVEVVTVHPPTSSGNESFTTKLAKD